MAGEGVIKAKGGDRASNSVDRENVMRWLARIGYGARGVVYVIIGGLALAAAVGAGGDTTGSRGALVVLLRQPWGQVLLSCVAAGLAAHAIWRLVQSVFDADDHGTDTKALLIRAGLFCSSVTYFVLTFYAGSLVFSGATSSGQSGESDRVVSWLMSKPYGEWIVVAAGLGIIGAGVSQIIKGWKEKFRKWLKLSRKHMKWAAPVSRFGLIARGIVFGMIGTLMIIAAVKVGQTQNAGLGPALRKLREWPMGDWLLGIMAVGLLAFAVYSFVEAASRRVDLD